MKLGLEHKVFIVSGSSRGIGKGISQALLDEGAFVVLTGRDVDSLKETHEKFLEQYEGQFLSVQGDLNCSDTLEEIEVTTLDQWGHIDGLVANAGAVRPMQETLGTEGDWDWYIESNFKVAYRFINRFAPLVRAQHGSIVIIGSIAGIEEIGAPLPYSASKAALAMYAKGLSRELANDGVRVNVVHPGNVIFPDGNWDRRMREHPEATQNMIEEKVPLGSFATPEDIAAATLFLLSGKARFITGSSLVVDGGQNSSPV